MKIHLVENGVRVLTLSCLQVRQEIEGEKSTLTPRVISASPRKASIANTSGKGTQKSGARVQTPCAAMAITPKTVAKADNNPGTPDTPGSRFSAQTPESGASAKTPGTGKMIQWQKETLTVSQRDKKILDNHLWTDCIVIVGEDKKVCVCNLRHDCGFISICLFVQEFKLHKSYLAKTSAKFANILYGAPDKKIFLFPDVTSAAFSVLIQ